jgi:hypothetical protein
VRAERATGAPKARQAESTPAQAEHARWQMVESPGCARSAPLERRRRDGRSARQRRRSTLAHGGVTGEARIILRSPIHMSSCTRTCTRSQNCERSHRHSLYSTKIRKKSQRAWTFFLLRSQSFSELLANQRRDRGEASLRSTDRRGMSLAVSPMKLID